MKRALRLVLPLAVAGASLVGITSTAHAGTWVDYQVYPNWQECETQGPAVAKRYDAGAWTCELYVGVQYTLRLFID